MPKNIIAAVTVAVVLSSIAAGDAYSAPRKSEFQKGMNYVTFSKERMSSKESDDSLKAISRTGAKWVSIVVTWYQESCSSTGIFPTDNSPGDESVIHAINTIHALKMKAVLKPHLELIDTSGGSWRGDIACSKEEWGEWFDSYGKFAVHYAKMAQDQKVEMFCIGTELSSISVMKEELWKEKVISPVRGLYSGPLVYAANWDEEYNNVVFWEDMDYVGIDAYFPLSDKDKPTYKEIVAGWEKWAKDIEVFQAKVNKPLVFTEAGYCSAQGTTKIPWEEVAKGPVDMQLQANCYKALMETFWQKRWFYGVYWWKWGTSAKFGGPNNRGFTPQNKTAQDIVKKWYGKSIPSKMYGK